MKHLRGALAICVMLALLMPCAAMAATVNAKVLAKAVEVIAKMETNGNYASVSNDSNGSPSVGIMQWNNGRAVSLLKSVIASDEAKARDILGDALYDELANGSGYVWKGKKLSSETRATVGKLLSTEAGKAKQDALAKKDVSGYIETAMKLGVTDGNALVYYADIAHQAGTGAVKKYVVKASQLAGSYQAITLKDMYDAAMTYATYTKTRRKKVYNLLVSSPVEGGADTPAVETPEKQPATPQTVAAKKVTLDRSGTVTLTAGETLTLKAALYPENASAALTWKSTKPSVASISSDGVVTANKAGTAVVGVITANGKKDTVKIRVKNIPVSSVEISGDASMKAGEKQQLSAVILPANAYDKSLQWKSSNKKIVVVSSKGMVLAKKKGVATVACRTKDGTKIIAKFKITVN